MSKGLRYRKRKIYIWRRIFLGGVLVAVIAGGVLLARSWSTLFPPFDTSIQGAAYDATALLAIPTPEPTPTPTPRPGDRVAKFPGEIVSVYNDQDGKNAYLTFDDGPTNLTPKVLDVLKEKNAKATFFTLGKNAEANPDIIRREFEEGHTVANHSYSHEYKTIYASVENFKADVEKADKVISDIIGTEYNTKVFRFPGGSFEKSKDPQKQWLSDNGYHYIDWNCLNGDAEGKPMPKPVDMLVSKVKSTSKGVNNVVILMHDAATKQTTVDALPAIIDYLAGEGYAFRTLGEAVEAY